MAPGKKPLDQELRMMVPERRGAGSVQLAEVGSDLLQDLVMLTQESQAGKDSTTGG